MIQNSRFCSPCHAVTAEQASQLRLVHRSGFPDDCQHIRDDGDCSSRLFADATSEDAEPDPYARAISRRNRLYVELTRRPTAASKTLTTGDGRSSMQFVPFESLDRPSCRRQQTRFNGTSRCSRPGRRSLPASATDPASRRADAIGRRATGRRFWRVRSWSSQDLPERCRRGCR